MPDLGILVELAAFYDVDIREIIDGERKSETMQEEMKETLTKVAEYSEAEKEKLERSVRRLNVAGLIGLLLFAWLDTTNRLDQYPVTDYIGGIGLGIAIAAMLVMLIQNSGGNLDKLCAWKKEPSGCYMGVRSHHSSGSDIIDGSYCGDCLKKDFLPHRGTHIGMVHPFLFFCAIIYLIRWQPSRKGPN